MQGKVRQTLAQFNMIEAGDTVLVGVSGGADSVALLLCLLDYRREVDFTIKVVHINHLIREDASSDAEFVCELCKEHSVECTVHEIDIEAMAKERHLSTEEAGRIARYEVMRQAGADKIAVGHHQDDLTETVLLNMCRGTGIHGITGISPVSGDVIRPLLYVSRSEIEQFLADRKQPYRTDSTNLTTDYMRNRFRLDIIPYLEKYVNERTVAHIADLARDMQEIEEHLENETSEAFEALCKPGKTESEIMIQKEGLISLKNFQKRELILKVLEKLTPHRKDITRNHVSAICDIANMMGEKKVDLPYGLEAVTTYEYLVIRKKDLEERGPLEIEIDKKELETKRSTQVVTEDGKVLKMRVFSRDADTIYPDRKYTKWVDYDKIECSLKLRNRQAGDYLMINDDLQKKNLKDYLINEKVPKEERQHKILIADGDHIIWVVDHRISAYYKISEQTKNILEIEVISD